MLSVHVIPMLKDNYAYFITDNVTSGVIDPSEPNTILEFLKNKKLDYILNTHHHWDHIGGNIDIKHKKHAKIIGAEIDQHRIPGIDTCVHNHFKFGDHTVNVLPVPGHTVGHIAFFFPQDKILFCGDTLFITGCGRVFEGTMQQMYNSLQLLKQLPDETKIYCGHEYTAYNIRFALKLEPNNEYLQNLYKKVRTLRKNLQPTVPSTILQEKLTNPFFRTDSLEIKKTLNMIDNTNLEVFEKIRTLKDYF